MNEYNEFKEEIRSLIREEIKSFLQEEGFYRCIPGEVTDVKGDKASVDTVTTVISNLLNKTGENLQTGDSVLLMEKYGSNYSNSFVLTKNGNNRINLENNFEELKDKAITSSGNIKDIYYSDSSIIFKTNDGTTYSIAVD